jgi:uncharacterized membrane protein
VSTPGGTQRHVFGDIALVVFLVAQVLDGTLTYIGVGLYGPEMEGNPLISWLMANIGEGLGLATAKITASFFGIVLHLAAVHKAVALLAALYVAVAIVPWTILIFVF